MWSEKITGTFNLINYPSEAHLQTLILDNVNFPPLQGWKVNNFIFSRIDHMTPSNYDNFPESVCILQISHNCFFDEDTNRVIATKPHNTVKKVVFLKDYEVANEWLFGDEKKMQKVRKIFPNAEIELRDNKTWETFHPINYNRLKKPREWPFTNTDSNIKNGLS